MPGNGKIRWPSETITWFVVNQAHQLHQEEKGLSSTTASISVPPDVQLDGEEPGMLYAFCQCVVCLPLT